MICIVCHKKRKDELCFECRQHYKKYPVFLRERILDHHRKLANIQEEN